MKISNKPSRSELYQLYIEQNIRRQDIANKYNVSESTIKKWLSGYRIIKPAIMRVQNSDKTLKEKYGDNIKHNTSLNYVKEEIKQSCLQKYGKVSYLATDECIKHTNDILIKKYGENPTRFGSKGFKEHMKRIYGVESYPKTEAYKNLYKDKNFVITQYIKRNNTMRKNGTLYTKLSIEERTCYKMLKEVFPDAISQYRDKERYPYYCDFYIPSLDMFIEYQGFWTHGTPPYHCAFDPLNENHIKMVNKWRNKGSYFYDTAIYVWTELDVKKRETARKNNLNFIELWNIVDFKKWLDSMRK